MNDVEKRRLMLLQEVRRNYADKNSPPAIHPRYQSVYHSLYNDSTEDDIRPRSTLFIRLVIAVFIFAFVFLLDHQQEKVANVSSQNILNEVQKDLFGQ